MIEEHTPETSTPELISEVPEESNYDHLLAAKTAYEKENWDAAEEHYSYLVVQQPENGSNWYYLGNVYANTNRQELAVNAYRQSILRDKSNIRAWNNLGFTHLQQAARTFINMKSQMAKDDPMQTRVDEIIRSLEMLLSETQE